MKKTEEGLCVQIMDYFEKNPDAGDTLEGIANWWVGPKKPGWTMEEVAETLNVLVKKGFIKKVGTQSGITIYKIKN